MQQEFPDLKKLPSLWSPSYFVATTGKVSTEVVKRYIESQRSDILPRQIEDYAEGFPRIIS